MQIPLAGRHGLGIAGVVGEDMTGSTAIPAGANSDFDAWTCC